MKRSRNGKQVLRLMGLSAQIARTVSWQNKMRRTKRSSVMRFTKWGICTLIFGIFLVSGGAYSLGIFLVIIGMLSLIPW